MINLNELKFSAIRTCILRVGEAIFPLTVEENLGNKVILEK